MVDTRERQRARTPFAHEFGIFFCVCSFGLEIPANAFVDHRVLPPKWTR
jgi:hypothetical protein